MRINSACVWPHVAVREIYVICNIFSAAASNAACPLCEGREICTELQKDTGHSRRIVC